MPTMLVWHVFTARNGRPEGAHWLTAVRILLDPRIGLSQSKSTGRIRWIWGRTSRPYYLDWR